MKKQFPNILFFILLSLISCTNNKEKMGNKIIEKIENYKVENRQLPANLTAIGIKETEQGPIYYEKKTDSTYIVWYGLKIGESRIYNSLDKKWK